MDPRKDGFKKLDDYSELVEEYKEPVKNLFLAPGGHSQLIKDIYDSFKPRFAPGAHLVYIKGLREKPLYFDQDLLLGFGVDLGPLPDPTLMPDLILYFKPENWLIFIEAETADSVLNSKKPDESEALFIHATARILHVLALPDRNTLAKWFLDISWETEVWCADNPTQLFHFNGSNLHRPY